MRTLFVLLLGSCSLLADDAAFNGRWNIKVIGERPRAWWLEVAGAGTANLSGKFVGAPGGGCDIINNLAARDGELSFSFTRGYRLKPGEKPTRTKGVYRAKLVEGKLEGTFAAEGQVDPPAKWVGMRAPEIADKDDGAWREAKPVKLFNGKNLKGWMPVEKGRELNWTVKNGAITNLAGAPNIISERKFWNFKLHMECRIPEHGNSGLGLRGRYEVQLQDDYGKPVESHINGSIYSRITPTSNPSKRAGEWQTFDVTLIGRDVTVVLNGVKIIDKQVIDGPTAICFDPDESAPGPIYIQGDHRPVEVRSVIVTPLVKKGS